MNQTLATELRRYFREAARDVSRRKQIVKIRGMKIEETQGSEPRFQLACIALGKRRKGGLA